MFSVRNIESVRFVQVPEPGLGLVHLAVWIEGGASLDPPGREGLANLAGAMLLRGTDRHSHRWVLSRVADLGGSLETWTTHDGILLTGEVTPRRLWAFLEVVVECLSRSRVPRTAFSQAKFLALEDLNSHREDDGELAWHFFNRLAWEGHPLERPSSGWMDTVPSIEAKDCRAFLQRQVHRGHLVVGLAGDLEEQTAQEVVMALSAALREGEPGSSPLPAPPRHSGLRVVVVDKPRRTQAQVVLGHPLEGWGSQDLLPLLVANTMIGGTWNSRLNQEIRETRGWSYEVHSTVSAGRDAGSFTVHFSPRLADLRPALEKTLTILEEIADRGLTEEEVLFGKEVLVNQFALQLATAQDRLEEALANVRSGRPDDYLTRFPDRVQAVSPTAVTRALATRLRPRDLSITLVAPARKVLPLLRDLPGLTSLRVVPFDQDRLPPENQEVREGLRGPRFSR